MAAMRPRRALRLLALVLVFSSCLAGPNTAHLPEAAGFWLGLWHGMVAPLAFLISLFSANVGVYEVHNTGHWYDLGFLIGMAMAYGGSHAGDRVRRRMLVSVEVKKR